MDNQWMIGKVFLFPNVNRKAKSCDMEETADIQKHYVNITSF
jgi:hypothetical protein